jgi:hypothetical protein
MGRYDGLIIPRSYSEYINKTDAATLSQALQLNNALDDTPTEDSRGGVRSGGVFDALAGKQPTLTFDNVPTEDSDNPVTSDGIYDALGGRSGLTWDSAPTEDSVNPVESGGVFNALETKQDTLIFDDTPTASSNNPVKSGGIFNAIATTDAKVLYDSYVVPAQNYPVGVTSINLTNISTQYQKPGYARFTIAYAEDQNYLICGISPLSNAYYLNVYNGYSGALNSKIVLYFIYIRKNQS